MVKEKTIYEEQIKKNPEEVMGDINKLNFTYNAHINKMIAGTCEGKEGTKFKQCFKEHSKIASDIYSIEDFYSDNFNASRNGEPSLDSSLEILKEILK